MLSPHSFIFFLLIFEYYALGAIINISSLCCLPIFSLLVYINRFHSRVKSASVPFLSFMLPGILFINLSGLLQIQAINRIVIFFFISFMIMPPPTHTQTHILT